MYYSDNPLSQDLHRFSITQTWLRQLPSVHLRLADLSILFENHTTYLSIREGSGMKSQTQTAANRGREKSCGKMGKSSDGECCILLDAK